MKKLDTNKKILYKRLGYIGIPSLAAVLALVLFFTGIFPGARLSKVHASDLMKDVKSDEVKPVNLSSNFINSTADFSVELFKQSYNKKENVLISPPSVFLALGMTANGADGNTLKEFESVLGNKGLSIKDLNSYYSSLSKKLVNVEKGKVSIANSIWYRDDKDLKINKDFLQTNSDYYKASAYKSDFDSKQAVKDINNWVKNNTGNLIDKVIDDIQADSMMYLVNAVYFEDEWQEIYKKTDVQEAPFKLLDGTEKSVDFMYSNETYLQDDKSIGFIKPYRNGKYSFVALLPNEGITLDNYVASLSGERFINILKNRPKVDARAGLPIFKAEYKTSLVDSLDKMGLKECFSPGKANFSKMGTYTPGGSTGSLYIGDVLHKTFITVDTKGTKAGAVTAVVMKGTGAVAAKPVILNRPFVYAIVDNETNLPLFIGTMVNP